MELKGANKMRKITNIPRLSIFFKEWKCKQSFRRLWWRGEDEGGEWWRARRGKILQFLDVFPLSPAPQHRKRLVDGGNKVWTSLYAEEWWGKELNSRVKWPNKIVCVCAGMVSVDWRNSCIYREFSGTIMFTQHPKRPLRVVHTLRVKRVGVYEVWHFHRISKH